MHDPINDDRSDRARQHVRQWRTSRGWKTCAHCDRQFRIGASLTREGVTYPLCHPNDGIGPDCYRLVTVYGDEIGYERTPERVETTERIMQALTDLTRPESLQRRRVDQERYERSIQIPDAAERERVREILAERRARKKREQGG